MSSNFKEFDFSQSIVTQYYKNPNTNGCIVKNKTETQTSHPLKSIIQLNEEPSEVYRVNIVDKNGNVLEEVYNYEDIEEGTQYYVDYNTSMVYFHNSVKGKEFVITYSSRGGTLIGANRIFTELDEEGNVVETLDKMISYGQQAIEVLDHFGGADKVVEKIDNANSLAEENITALNTQSARAETNLTNLNTQNTRAERDLNNLGTANTRAETNLNNLGTQNTRAEENIDDLNDSSTRAETDNAILNHTIETADSTRESLEEVIQSGGVYYNNRNLIINGGFNSLSGNTEHWTIQGTTTILKNNQDKPVDIELKANCVSITNSTGNAYIRQLNSSNHFNVKNGDKGILQFYARGTEGTTTIIDQNEYGLIYGATCTPNQIVLSSDWELYTIEFEVTHENIFGINFEIPQGKTLCIYCPAIFTMKSKFSYADQDLGALLEKIDYTTISNANNATTTGHYYTNSETVNLPMISSKGYLDVKGNGEQCVQVWYKYTDNEVYTRAYNKFDSYGEYNESATPTWKSWEKLTKSSSDYDWIKEGSLTSDSTYSLIAKYMLTSTCDFCDTFIVSQCRDLQGREINSMIVSICGRQERDHVNNISISNLTTPIDNTEIVGYYTTTLDGEGHAVTELRVYAHSKAKYFTSSGKSLHYTYSGEVVKRYYKSPLLPVEPEGTKTIIVESVIDGILNGNRQIPSEGIIQNDTHKFVTQDEKTRISSSVTSFSSNAGSVREIITPSLDTAYRHIKVVFSIQNKANCSDFTAYVNSQQIKKYTGGGNMVFTIDFYRDSSSHSRNCRVETYTSLTSSGSQIDVFYGRINLYDDLTVSLSCDLENEIFENSTMYVEYYN